MCYNYFRRKIGDKTEVISMIKLYMFFVIMSILYTYHAIFVGDKEVRSLRHQTKTLKRVSANIIGSIYLDKGS